MLDVKREINLNGERVVREERVPLVVHLPALPIVENDDVAADPVRDRIVVIGGSNAESRDMFLTPVGAMPGSMVLLNAINSLLQQGQLHQLPTLLGLGIGIVLGMAVGLCLYVFQFAIAIALSGLVVGIVIWLLVWQWITVGVWLDVGAPMFAMILHRWYDVLHTMWHDRHQHGWRTVLAPRFRRWEATNAARHVGRATAVALAVSIAAAALPAAANGLVAGYVTAISGDSRSFVILRGQKVIAITDYFEVWDGDQVIVRGKGHIEITRDDELPPLVVTQQDLPVRIDAHGRGFIPRSFDWVGKVITHWSDIPAHNREAVEMKIRGSVPNEALALPLLKTPVRQRIVAGTR